MKLRDTESHALDAAKARTRFADFKANGEALSFCLQHSCFKVIQQCS